MALIDCPDCSGRVSDLAAACPQCGRPILEEAPRTARDPVDESLEIPEASPATGGIDQAVNSRWGGLLVKGGIIAICGAVGAAVAGRAGLGFGLLAGAFIVYTGIAD